MTRCPYLEVAVKRTGDDDLIIACQIFGLVVTVEVMMDRIRFLYKPFRGLPVFLYGFQTCTFPASAAAPVFVRRLFEVSVNRTGDDDFHVFPLLVHFIVTVKVVVYFPGFFDELILIIQPALFFDVFLPAFLTSLTLVYKHIIGRREPAVPVTDDSQPVCLLERIGYQGIIIRSIPVDFICLGNEIALGDNRGYRFPVHFIIQIILIFLFIQEKCESEQINPLSQKNQYYSL